jgi:hypothetical protein
MTVPILDASACREFRGTPASSGVNRLERLYDELVVMAPSAKKKANEFESIDTPRARHLVNIEIKKIVGIDFEKFVYPKSKASSLKGPMESSTS